MYKKQHRKDAG